MGIRKWEACVYFTYPKIFFPHCLLFFFLPTTFRVCLIPDTVWDWEDQTPRNMVLTLKKAQSLVFKNKAFGRKRKLKFTILLFKWNPFSAGPMLSFFWNSWDGHGAMQGVTNRISKDLISSLFLCHWGGHWPPSLPQSPHLKRRVSQNQLWESCKIAYGKCDESYKDPNKSDGPWWLQFVLIPVNGHFERFGSNGDSSRS